MTAKQNLVFFLGITLMVFSLWKSGRLSVLYHTAFRAYTQPGSTNPSKNPPYIGPVLPNPITLTPQFP